MAGPRYVMQQAQVQASYEGAGHGTMAQGWYGATPGLDASLGSGLSTLRARSWDAYQNYILARAGIRRLVDWVVGSGARLGLTLGNDKANQKILKEFNRWCRRANADGGTLEELESILLTEMFVGGDALAMIKRRPASMGLNVPFQLVAMGGDFLSEWRNTAIGPGNYCRGGIEFDPDSGLPVYFHVFQRNPRDIYGTFGSNYSSYQTVAIPAESVMFMRHRATAQQLRGEPILSQVLYKLRDMAVFDAAQLATQKAAAHITGWVKSANPDEGSRTEDGLTPAFPRADGPPTHVGAEGGDVVEAAPGVGGHDGAGMMHMQPGMFMPLDPGEDIVFAPAKDVGQQYESFMRMQLRLIAAALGIPYESLFPDNSQGSDRMARVGHMDLKKYCGRIRERVLVDQFLNPTWRAWVDWALLMRVIKLPRGVSADDLKDAAQWSWDPWGYINPLQDAQSFEVMVQNDFITKSEVRRQLGFDPAQMDMEIALEQEREKMLGIGEPDFAPKPDKESGPQIGVDGEPEDGSPAADGAPPASARSKGLGSGSRAALMQARADLVRAKAALHESHRAYLQQQGDTE